jgi:DNA (cytosine-5)-methyltransferase 1
MSLGMARAGCEIVGAVEIDAKAIKSYANNLLRTASPEIRLRHSLPRDIREFGPEQFAREVLQTNDPAGSVDVIVGGPPCQTFSRVGRAKLRTLQENPDTDDRANLYLHYLRYVDYFRPLVVLMENVPDIMNYKGQNVAEEIASSLEELGYCCRYTVLNAAHYGVPQTRPRFYLLAFLQELQITPSFPAPSHQCDLPEGYEHALQVALKTILVEDGSIRAGARYVPGAQPVNTLPKAVSAEEAIGDLPLITAHLESRKVPFDTQMAYRTEATPSAYAQDMRNWPGLEPSQVVTCHTTRQLKRDYLIFARMKPGDQYPEAKKVALAILNETLDQYLLEMGIRPTPDSRSYNRLLRQIVPPYDEGKFPNKWRKLEPEKPVRTLTAHLGKDSYTHIHYDSSQGRVISAREAARLQSFPDSFVFFDSMTAAFRQIGNAVPPLQAYALGRHISHLLEQLLRHTTLIERQRRGSATPSRVEHIPELIRRAP